MLPDLLPTTGYLLAYVLPILLLSLPLTFAGAFLTIDRTRVFTPRKDARYNMDSSLSTGGKGRRRYLFLLEGGLGGLAGGYLFGVHITTFLALLIPAVTSSPSLGKQTFLVVWILASIPTTYLGARFRYAALAFLGITGGATLALAVIIIIHPSLIARVVLLSLFTAIVALFVLLPLKATQHHALRLAACSTGAYGLILSAALLSHASSWSSIDGRLWISDGEGWGTPAEQGLSAGFCLLLATGAACDWFLHRKFGTNPDQRWDAYLADYAANLPNAGERAGVFQPLVSPFAKLLHKHRDDPMSVPDDDEIYDIKRKEGQDAPPPYAQGVRLQRPRKASLAKSPLSPDVEASPFTYAARPGFLKKKSTRRVAPGSPKSGRKREGVKFRPLEDFEGLTSDEDSDVEGHVPVGRPWLSRPDSTASLSAASGTTLIGEGSQTSKSKHKAKHGKGMDDESDFDIEKERAAIAKRRSQADGDKGAVDYSDYESDGSTSRRASARGAPGWSPEFIRRASQRSRGTISSSGGLTTPGALSTAPTTPGQARAVPATPSLIRAVDRLAAAQEAAYGTAGPGLGSGYGFPIASGPSGGAAEVLVPHPVQGQQDNGERWMSFWRDVKDKAGDPTSPKHGVREGKS